MSTSNRVNVYLRDEANRAIETLFTRLQEAGEIPRNATIEDIGKYRAQIITYALNETVRKGLSDDTLARSNT